METRRTVAWRVARALAGLVVGSVVGAGCGAGVYDGQGDLVVTQSIGPGPGEIRLGQARFSVTSGSLSAPTTITLRRRAQSVHPGPLGPVFVLAAQGAAFKRPPVLQIGVSQGEAVPADAQRIAYRGGGTTDYQWIPLTSGYAYDPATQSVRSDVTTPFGGGTQIEFGLLAWCGRDGARVESCLGQGQVCAAGICQ